MGAHIPLIVNAGIYGFLWGIFLDLQLRSSSAT